MNYIVDGYNLAFKIEQSSQKLKDGQTDLVIKQVVHFVKTGIKNQRSKIIIVFDGQASTRPSKSSYRGISLLFSKRPQTADDIIRNFIRKTKNIGKWTVVSSDNEILFTAQDHGAQTMKVTEFIQMRNKLLPGQRKLSGNFNKQNPQNIDVEYWRQLFNSGNDS